MKGKKKELANQIAAAVGNTLNESGELSKTVKKAVEKAAKKLADKLKKIEIKADKKLKTAAKEKKPVVEVKQKEPKKSKNEDGLKSTAVSESEMLAAN
ncbi:hypothetical protein [Dyadobacter bucti]|jgi:TRAP-type C4-dicarboxylate transport system substrate-binding protein|uniref:hypothetical protein n=1 Tax=Dyadobacter bucti TaxID=2572203 RepID=UPI00110840FE|nr:hypothetical protein [Dyadobacter bucti]